MPFVGRYCLNEQAADHIRVSGEIGGLDLERVSDKRRPPLHIQHLHNLRGTLVNYNTKLPVWRGCRVGETSAQPQCSFWIAFLIEVYQPPLRPSQGVVLCVDFFIVSANYLNQLNPGFRSPL